MSSPFRRSATPDKFAVYQNAAVSSALAARPVCNAVTLRRALIAFGCAVVTWGMLSVAFRKESLSITINTFHLNHTVAKAMLIFVRTTLTFILVCAVTALFKMLNSSVATAKSSVQALKLTPRQQALIGMRTPQNTPPTKHRPSPVPSSSPSPLVPIHPSSMFRKTPSSTRLEAASPVTPLQVSSFPYTSPPSASGAAAAASELCFNPWIVNARNDDIRNEQDLEKFVADVGSKLADSTGKPPNTPQNMMSSPMRAIGTLGASPSPVSTTPQQSSATPIRVPARVSPSQKSPKKTECDLPAPFSMEQTVEGFRRLGVYPQIEQWRDSLRQWFSDVLLGPLVQKIDRSHLQVMEAAAKLGLTLQISPIGGSKKENNSTTEGYEWHTTFAPDEDALIHQFRASLLNARNAATTSPSIFGLKPTQQPEVNPQLQECLDAVTEHQRLRALVKGEWVKGLLPQSSVRADYTIQRLRELAEGTCVKNFEFAGTGEVYDKTTKRWSLELPTDAHLLVYLFCALLEHPQWMLHVDPASYPNTQSGNDPLFIANLPQKDRIPEKYVAVLSSAPPVLHTGACILAVGKQSPPIFALYWDKRLQFSLQGRTALWDAILLFCHRIKVAHGGVVRGLHLGGSAFNLLSLLNQSES